MLKRPSVYQTNMTMTSMPSRASDNPPINIGMSVLSFSADGACLVNSVLGGLLMPISFHDIGVGFGLLETVEPAVARMVEAPRG